MRISIFLKLPGKPAFGEEGKNERKIIFKFVANGV